MPAEQSIDRVALVSGRPRDAGETRVVGELIDVVGDLDPVNGLR